MKKNNLRTAVTCCLIFMVTAVRAQEKYLLLNPSCNTSAAATDAIFAIDNRQDNQLLGFVQTGIANRTTEIRYNGTLVDSIIPFFKNVNPDGKLVVVLNEFNLWEYRDSGEIGRFKLSLRFFKQMDDKYIEFMTHDSLYSVKGMDVTKKLLSSVSKNLCAVSELAKTEYIRTKDSAEGPFYDFGPLQILDSLEKLDIPIFQNEPIREGIYANYREFRANKPGDSSEIESDARNPNSVKIHSVTKKGKRVKVPHENIYAVCDGSKIFKSLSSGFYEMVKEGNDYYYVRPATIGGQTNFAPLIVGGLIGGAIGGALAALITSQGANSGPLVLYKINHRRGNAIPLSRYKK